MNFPILGDNPVGGRSSRIHNKYAQNDKKLPLKWRFSWVVHSAGHRLWTVSPEVRHFSFWIYLRCSVATGVAEPPAARWRYSRHQPQTVVDDVRQKKDPRKFCRSEVCEISKKGWVHLRVLSTFEDTINVFSLLPQQMEYILKHWRFGHWRSTKQVPHLRLEVTPKATATLKSGRYNICYKTCFLFCCSIPAQFHCVHELSYIYGVICHE